MAYDIRRTDGTVFVTVEDGTLDKTTTSIQFIGKRYPEYGLILNENDLHQLENFSNPTPPINPVIGQMWYDNTPSIEALKVFTGGISGWRGLGFSNNFSDTSIGDNLTFSGTARFINEVRFNGFVEFTTITSFVSTLQFTENAKFIGDILSEADITFTGASIFTGTVTFSSGLTFGGVTAFDSTASFNAGLTALSVTTTGAVTASGNVTSGGIVQSDIGLYANEYAAGLSPASLLDNLVMYGAEIDGLDLNTVLYLNFAGTDGATVVVDLAPGTLTNGGAGPNNSILFSGTAAIDVFRTRLENGSLLLDGNSDYLTVTDNTNYDFGTEPFVMDGWFYTEAASTEQVIMAKGTATTDRWEIFINGSNQLAFEYSDAVDTISIAGGLTSTFKWTHWALERVTSATNSIVTLYLDGQRVATATVVLADYDFDDITDNVIIGRRGYGTFEYFDGNFDEIRIEKSVPKYNGGFRPRQITDDNNDGLFYKNSAGQEFRTTFETNNW